jgi:excisionase family DNA binding protein
MPTAVPDLIDIETLARRLGDSVRHVRRLVADKRIPYLKVGHFIRFDPEEIATWLNAQRVGVGGSSIVGDECAESPPALAPNENTAAVGAAPLRHSRRRTRGKEPSSLATLW